MWSWLSLGFPLPEGASEEPGDEGSDGSDEEPAVGRQRHADAQEVTAPPETLLRHAFLHRQKDCIVAKPGETRESVCFVFFCTGLFPLWCCHHHFISGVWVMFSVELGWEKPWMSRDESSKTKPVSTRYTPISRNLPSLFFLYKAADKPSFLFAKCSLNCNFAAACLFKWVLDSCFHTVS